MRRRSSATCEAMVLASACCSEETRAYKETRRILFVRIIAYTSKNEITRRDAASWWKKTWPSEAGTTNARRGAPIHRRGKAMVVRSDCVVRCEPKCVGKAAREHDGT